MKKLTFAYGFTVEKKRMKKRTKLENHRPRNCFSNSVSGHEEKSIVDIEKLKDMDMSEHGKLSESGDSPVVDAKLNANRVMSEGLFPVQENLSDTLDATWTGEIHRGPVLSKKNSFSLPDIASVDLEDRSEVKIVPKVYGSPSPALFSIGSENMEEFVSWLKMPFLSFYRSSNKIFFGSSSKLDALNVYDQFNISSFRELELQGGARLLLPVGVNDTFIPVYDDELTSSISYALVPPEYHFQISDNGDRPKDWGESMSSLSIDSVYSQSFHSVDDMPFDPHRSFCLAYDSTRTRSSLIMDPPSSMKSLHVRVSFGDDGSDKVKYTVTRYYAKWVERAMFSLQRPWTNGLSLNMSQRQLESFTKFAPKYFKYLSEAIRSRSPTGLAKVLCVYQVMTKQLKGGKESRINVLVMENLLFRRSVTRLYDLKGSSRSRYNPDYSGSNKVLLGQNLTESIPTNPILVGNKAKRLLERAVWNDTAFLAVSFKSLLRVSMHGDPFNHKDLVAMFGNWFICCNWNMKRKRAYYRH
ncbi:Phosphatidylinositol-4-phosphate 5-kinase family protein [Hibiscus syriacus]|uniref:Phosphatidylinositol-4-phosphate 5-kinase family protein n=1 Tax=Hibiscus syriacus TaxID=106335 RepID=A0A6A2WGC4_HIBSY|nr:Phosphatidylinositol-4-phosphate 5-kinase family protein [Hibiscus syriacus]